MIHIVGKEDFGTNTSILIYLVNSYDNNFKFYAGKRKGFIEINIDKRLKLLNEKIDLVGANFIKMIKVFNSLFYNINGFMPNQILIESILYSCPNDLFEGNEIYKVFIKIVNYLTIKSLKDIKSMNNQEKTINEDVVCGRNISEFYRMLEYLSK